MNNKGFTLLELMIVVTIIGILAAIVISGGGSLFNLLAVIGFLFVFGVARIATEEWLQKFENTPHTTTITIDKEN